MVHAICGTYRIVLVAAWDGPTPPLFGYFFCFLPGSCCGKTPLPNKSCILKGEIPSQINHLEHLQVLSLYKHHIAGGIPPIGKLQNLKILQLSVKNMSGPLPKELYSLENLEILDIHDNNFVGTISHDIENTKALELLSLYNNKFDCEIPWTSMSILEILCECLHPHAAEVSCLHYFVFLAYTHCYGHYFVSIFPALCIFLFKDILYLDGNMFVHQSYTREICSKTISGDLRYFTVPPTVSCQCATTV